VAAPIGCVNLIRADEANARVAAFENYGVRTVLEAEHAEFLLLFLCPRSFKFINYVLLCSILFFIVETPEELKGLSLNLLHIAVYPLSLQLASIKRVPP